MEDALYKQISVAGFTLVELITVLLVAGILAAIVAPRFFDNNTFQSRGFADQVQATLRYAQKSAIAQRRFVCVAFGTNSVTLTLDTTPHSSAHTSATCPGSDLAGPAGPVSPPPCAQNTYSVCSGSSSFTAIPAGFDFDALGRPSFASNQTITVSNATNSIVVEAETGYVHSP